MKQTYYIWRGKWWRRLKDGEIIRPEDKVNATSNSLYLGWCPANTSRYGCVGENPLLYYYRRIHCKKP